MTRKLTVRDVTSGYTTEGGIVSLERCQVCDSRVMPPASRLELLTKIALDGLDEMLEDNPKRPNNLCPTHWQGFIDLRNGGFGNVPEHIKRQLGIGWKKE